MKVSSTAFAHGGVIPARHTGFGEDLSPALSVTEIPEGTVSLAVILDDLDVPFTREFTHWVAWNLPPADIPEGLPAGAVIERPVPAVQGRAWGKHRYRGPKQPFFIRNVHRYVFTVYALDTGLDLPSEADKARLMEAMRGHILAQTALMGTAQRP